MNKVKYKLNREWLNELLKHKNDSNVYFSLSDNDIRILLTYIDVLQSKIGKAIEYCEYNDEDLYTFEPDYDYEENMVDNYEPSNFREELLDILKEDK